MPRLFRPGGYPRPGKPQAFDVTFRVHRHSNLTVLAVEPDGSTLAKSARLAAELTVGGASCAEEEYTVRYLFFAGGENERAPRYRVKPPFVIETEVPGAL